MAIATLHRENSAATDDIAVALSGLASCADRARELEQLVEDTKSVLSAIGAGGLLDATPADSADCERHNTATNLLQMLGRQLDRFDAIDPHGDALSGRLETLARQNAA